MAFTRAATTALTVVGGGHSGHYLRPGVVAVDKHAFDRVSVVAADGPFI